MWVFTKHKDLLQFLFFFFFWQYLVGINEKNIKKYSGHYGILKYLANSEGKNMLSEVPSNYTSKIGASL